MKKLLKAFNPVILAIIFGLCLAPASGFAKDITLAWDPSPSSGVVGYKIYYQADSAQLPMIGTEAVEGSSPIDVGNVTTFTLTGLSEWSVYYFRTTAYDSDGNESELSNLVASEWIPTPLSPESNSVVGSPAQLVWTSPPADLDLTFTVYYGENPVLTSSTVVAGGNNSGPGLPPQGYLIAVLVCLIGLTLQQLLSTKGRRRLAGLAICGGLALATVSCGGGGGGGDGDVSTTSTSVSPVNNTVVVSGLTDSSLITEDLDPGSTYYWKVVAVDEYGQEFESQTSSFTAQ